MAFNGAGRGIPTNFGASAPVVANLQPVNSQHADEYKQQPGRDQVPRAPSPLHAVAADIVAHGNNVIGSTAFHNAATPAMANNHARAIVNGGSTAPSTDAHGAALPGFESPNPRKSMWPCHNDTEYAAVVEHDSGFFGEGMSVWTASPDAGLEAGIQQIRATLQGTDKTHSFHLYCIVVLRFLEQLLRNRRLSNGTTTVTSSVPRTGAAFYAATSKGSGGSNGTGLPVGIVMVDQHQYQQRQQAGASMVLLGNNNDNPRAPVPHQARHHQYHGSNGSQQATAAAAGAVSGHGSIVNTAPTQLAGAPRTSITHAQRPTAASQMQPPAGLLAAKQTALAEIRSSQQVASASQQSGHGAVASAARHSILAFGAEPTASSSTHFSAAGSSSAALQALPDRAPTSLSAAVSVPAARQQPHFGPFSSATVPPAPSSGLQVHHQQPMPPPARSISPLHRQVFSTATGGGVGGATVQNAQPCAATGATASPSLPPSPTLNQQGYPSFKLTGDALQLSSWPLPHRILVNYRDKKNITRLYPWQAACLGQPGVLLDYEADSSRRGGSQGAAAAGPAAAHHTPARVPFPSQSFPASDPLCSRPCNLVYNAPTSGGKSMVAEILLLHRLLVEPQRGEGAQEADDRALRHLNEPVLPSSERPIGVRRLSTALVVLPYISLVEEKSRYLKDLFGRQYRTNNVRVLALHSGKRGVFNHKYRICVCTIEKANALVNGMIRDGSIADLRTVIVDELHMVGDKDRGHSLEVLLTKLRYLQLMSADLLHRPPGQPSSSSPATSAAPRATSKAPISCPVQIIGMSATLPNLNVIAEWLGARLFVSNYRPVALTESLMLLTADRTATLHTVRITDATNDDAVLSGPSSSASANGAAMAATPQQNHGSAARGAPPQLPASSRKPLVNINNPTSTMVLDRNGSGSASVGTATNKSGPSYNTGAPPYHAILTLCRETVRSGGQALVFAASHADVEKIGNYISQHLFASPEPIPLVVPAHGVSAGATTGAAGGASAISALSGGGGGGAASAASAGGYVNGGAAGGGGSSSAVSTGSVDSDAAHPELSRRRELQRQLQPAPYYDPSHRQQRERLVAKLNYERRKQFGMAAALGGARQRDTQPTNNVQKLLLAGIGTHHAGMRQEERAAVEEGFKRRYLLVLVATSTLAAGVNLPARRVIFPSLYIWRGRGMVPLDVVSYRQMAGRAGRAGHDAVGEAVMVVSNRDDFLPAIQLMRREPEPAMSSLIRVVEVMGAPGSANGASVSAAAGNPPRLAQPTSGVTAPSASSSSSSISSRDLDFASGEGHGLLRVVLESIVGNVVPTQRDLLTFISCSLHAKQNGAEAVQRYALQALEWLSRQGFIARSVTGPPAGVHSAPFATADSSKISLSSCPTGDAAFQAAVPPCDATFIHDELVRASRNLFLGHSDIHLLYCAMPARDGSGGDGITTWRAFNREEQMSIDMMSHDGSAGYHTSPLHWFQFHVQALCRASPALAAAIGIDINAVKHLVRVQKWDAGFQYRKAQLSTAAGAAVNETKSTSAAPGAASSSAGLPARKPNIDTAPAMAAVKGAGSSSAGTATRPEAFGVIAVPPISAAPALATFTAQDQIVYKRLYQAFAIRDLMYGRADIQLLSELLRVPEGRIESFKLSCISHASMTASFALNMGWRNFAVLIAEVRDKMACRVPRELMSLMDVKGQMTVQRARALYDAGISRLQDLVIADAIHVADALERGLPFRPLPPQLVPSSTAGGAAAGGAAAASKSEADAASAAKAAHAAWLHQRQAQERKAVAQIMSSAAATHKAILKRQGRVAKVIERQARAGLGPMAQGSGYAGGSGTGLGSYHSNGQAAGPSGFKVFGDIMQNAAAGRASVDAIAAGTRILAGIPPAPNSAAGAPRPLAFTAQISGSASNGLPNSAAVHLAAGQVPSSSASAAPTASAPDAILARPTPAGASDLKRRKRSSVGSIASCRTPMGANHPAGGADYEATALSLSRIGGGHGEDSAHEYGNSTYHGEEEEEHGHGGGDANISHDDDIEEGAAMDGDHGEGDDDEEHNKDRVYGEDGIEDVVDEEAWIRDELDDDDDEDDDDTSGSESSNTDDDSDVGANNAAAHAGVASAGSTNGAGAGVVDAGDAGVDPLAQAEAMGVRVIIKAASKDHRRQLSVPGASMASRNPHAVPGTSRGTVSSTAPAVPTATSTITSAEAVKIEELAEDAAVQQAVAADLQAAAPAGAPSSASLIQAAAEPSANRTGVGMSIVQAHLNSIIHDAPLDLTHVAASQPQQSHEPPATDDVDVDDDVAHEAAIDDMLEGEVAAETNEATTASHAAAGGAQQQAVTSGPYGPAGREAVPVPHADAITVAMDVDGYAPVPSVTTSSSPLRGSQSAVPQPAVAYSAAQPSRRVSWLDQVPLVHAQPFAPLVRWPARSLHRRAPPAVTMTSFDYGVDSSSPESAAVASPDGIGTNPAQGGAAARTPASSASRRSTSSTASSKSRSTSMPQRSSRRTSGGSIDSDVGASQHSGGVMVTSLPMQSQPLHTTADENRAYPTHTFVITAPISSVFVHVSAHHHHHHHLHDAAGRAGGAPDESTGGDEGSNTSAACNRLSLSGILDGSITDLSMASMNNSGLQDSKSDIRDATAAGGSGAAASGSLANAAFAVHAQHDQIVAIAASQKLLIPTQSSSSKLRPTLRIEHHFEHLDTDSDDNADSDEDGDLDGFAQEDDADAYADVELHVLPSLTQGAVKHRGVSADSDGSMDRGRHEGGRSARVPAPMRTPSVTTRGGEPPFSGASTASSSTISTTRSSARKLKGFAALGPRQPLPNARDHQRQDAAPRSLADGEQYGQSQQQPYDSNAIVDVSIGDAPDSQGVPRSAHQRSMMLPSPTVDLEAGAAAVDSPLDAGSTSRKFLPIGFNINTDGSGSRYPKRARKAVSPELADVDAAAADAAVPFITNAAAVNSIASAEKDPRSALKRPINASAVSSSGKRGRGSGNTGSGGGNGRRRVSFMPDAHEVEVAANQEDGHALNAAASAPPLKPSMPVSSFSASQRRSSRLSSGSSVSFQPAQPSPAATTPSPLVASIRASSSVAPNNLSHAAVAKRVPLGASSFDLEGGPPSQIEMSALTVGQQPTHGNRLVLPSQWATQTHAATQRGRSSVPNAAGIPAPAPEWTDRAFRGPPLDASASSILSLWKSQRAFSIRLAYHPLPRYSHLSRRVQMEAWSRWQPVMGHGFIVVDQASPSSLPSASYGGRGGDGGSSLTGEERVVAGISICWGASASRRFYIPLPPPLPASLGRQAPVPAFVGAAATPAAVAPSSSSYPALAASNLLALAPTRERPSLYTRAGWSGVPRPALHRIMGFVGFAGLDFVTANVDNPCMGEARMQAALSMVRTNRAGCVCRKWWQGYCAAYSTAWHCLVPSRWRDIARMLRRNDIQIVAHDMVRMLKELQYRGIAIPYAELADPRVGHWLIDQDAGAGAAGSDPSGFGGDGIPREYQPSSVAALSLESLARYYLKQGSLEKVRQENKKFIQRVAAAADQAASASAMRLMGPLQTPATQQQAQGSNSKVKGRKRNSSGKQGAAGLPAGAGAGSPPVPAHSQPPPWSQPSQPPAVVPYLVLDPGIDLESDPTGRVTDVQLRAALANWAASVGSNGAGSHVVGRGGHRRHCIQTGVLTWAVMSVVGACLRASMLEKPFRYIEMPLTRVLASMEAGGIGVDMQHVVWIKKVLRQRAVEVEDEMKTIADKCGYRNSAGAAFNPRDDTHLSELLFDYLDCNRALDMVRAEQKARANGGRGQGGAGQATPAALASSCTSSATTSAALPLPAPFGFISQQAIQGLEKRRARAATMPVIIHAAKVAPQNDKLQQAAVVAHLIEEHRRLCSMPERNCTSIETAWQDREEAVDRLYALSARHLQSSSVSPAASRAAGAGVDSTQASNVGASATSANRPAAQQLQLALDAVPSHGRIHFDTETASSTGRVYFMNPGLQTLPRDFTVPKAARPSLQQELDAGTLPMGLLAALVRMQKPQPVGTSSSSSSSHQSRLLAALPLQYHDLAKVSLCYRSRPGAEVRTRQGVVLAVHDLAIDSPPVVVNGTLAPAPVLPAAASQPAPTSLSQMPLLHPDSSTTVADHWRSMGFTYRDEDLARIRQVSVMVTKGGSSSMCVVPSDRIYRIAAAPCPAPPLTLGATMREDPFSDMRVSMRDAIVAAPGYVLLAADYSQAEARLMTHFSADQQLLKAFRSGTDVIRCMAAQWLGKDTSSISDDERQNAKKVLYGIMYGAGPGQIAAQLGCDFETGRRYIGSFKRVYRGLAMYMARVVQGCRKDKHVTTLFGRRRHLPQIDSVEAGERRAAERKAVNTVCQGSAADLIKIAMTSIHSKLHEEYVRQPLMRMQRLHAFAYNGTSGGNGANRRASGAGVTQATQIIPKQVSPGNTTSAISAAAAPILVSTGLPAFIPPPGRLVLQIHDELLLEVREDLVDEVAAMVKQTMEEVAASPAARAARYSPTQIPPQQARNGVVGSACDAVSSTATAAPAAASPSAIPGHSQARGGLLVPLEVKIEVGRSWGSMRPHEPGAATTLTARQ